MKSIKSIAISTLLLLSGCVSNPIQEAVNPPVNTTPISVAPLVMFVPNDPGLYNRSTNGIVRDIKLDNVHVTAIPGAWYNRILVEEKTSSSFFVHVRSDNGIAGSGVKYRVQYGASDSKEGYTVKFQPVEKSAYQQGLIGKFPLPTFNESNLISYLKSFSIHYKFEVDSPYNTESVYSNFTRMATALPFARGEVDPVTGKVFKSWFVTKFMNSDVRYVVETFPYRNGSKCVIYVSIPAIETSPNMVDFSVVIKELRKELINIASA